MARRNSSALAETFIAYNLASDPSYEGTLPFILDQMESDNADIDDFLFYKAVRIDVKLEKKLTLVVA